MNLTIQHPSKGGVIKYSNATNDTPLPSRPPSSIAQREPSQGVGNICGTFIFGLCIDQ